MSRLRPELGRLQIAHDPDELLLDEANLAILAGRGFRVPRFEDEVAFRLEYESRFRARWDAGASADGPAVLVHFAGEALEDLPWDIAQAGVCHRLALAEWFPDLALAVVRALPSRWLARLFERYRAHKPGPLGDNATADFILFNVFKITDTLIETEADLLRLLLELHFRPLELPDPLVQRLAQLLEERPSFQDWPLRLLLGDRQAFLAFIEERWPLAVAAALGHASSTKAAEPPMALYPLRLPGPARLPFADEAVRVVLDNLFLEGLLHPLRVTEDARHLPVWMRAGIAVDDASVRVRHMETLLARAVARLPAAEARHGDWIQYGWLWAETLNQWHGLPLDHQPALADRFDAAQQGLDARFRDWLADRYGLLASLPAVNVPVMGHHVPHYLARQQSSSQDRIALIVMDGMAMAQWLPLQQRLEREIGSVEYRRGGLFAWLPTLTSIARQALFAGRAPRHLPSLISTQGEPAAWIRFWNGQGLSADAVAYFKGIRHAAQLAPVHDALADPRLRVIGIVIDVIDEMMHGSILGVRGLHAQIAVWQEQGMLAHLLARLLDQNFRVFLTADHGNIEATGAGAVAQGVLAETRGERARIYSDRTLRDKTLAELGSRAVAGATTGLPEGMFPLYATGRTAFVSAGKIVVAHGGATLEELIVPFVQVRGKPAHS